ncbi:MAG: matrixin family metalloprotease [Vampirovibrio sp.]|nr:matrixin family metalloprotease [Vampirovibrio sp.]
MRIGSKYGIGRRFTLNPAVSSTDGEEVSGEIAPAEIAGQAGVPVLDFLTAWPPPEPFGHRQSVRWPTEALPLSIAIASRPDSNYGAKGSDDTLQEGNMEAYIFSVFREWEFASGGLIRLVNAVEVKADIQVVWAQEAVLGREFEVGHTDRKVSGNGCITQATITLLCSPAIDGSLSAPQQLKRLRATLLHEMGHALGLEHSSNTQDVMHYRGWQNAFLTEGDIQRLKALYQYQVSDSRQSFMG